MAPSRRKLIASAGTVITGGLAAGLATQTAEGQSSVDVNGLSIPNSSTTTNNQIKDVIISVDGSYEYDGGVEPSRIVIRLEGKTTDNYRQLDATEITPSGGSNAGDYTLTGSVMDLKGMANLVPEMRGKSNSIGLDLRVSLEISHNGRTVSSANASDSTELDFTKSEVSIGASIGGNGDVSIETTTPT